MNAVLRRLDLPPVWAAGAAALAWAAARAAPAPSPGLAGWPAGIVAAAGLALAIWSAAWFLRRRTPIEPRREPRALITEGPFRVNRNPIYTGTALILLGWALQLDAAAALIPVAAFPVVIGRRFIAAEEDALRRRFGPEAEAWLARTRRW